MPAALPLERIRDAFSGSYTIDRELGRGGMATVYLAQDAKHERLVALKVLSRSVARDLAEHVPEPIDFFQRVVVHGSHSDHAACFE